MNVKELRPGNYVLGKETGEECNMQHVCVVVGLDGTEEGDLLNCPITIKKTEITLLSTDNTGELEFDAEFCDSVEPIELTEEWVDGFGFSDKEYKTGYIGIDFKANLIIDFVLTKPKVLGEWQDYYVWEHVKNMYTKLEFVHDLQNLFHAITKQELTFTIDGEVQEG